MPVCWLPNKYTKCGLCHFCLSVVTISSRTISSRHYLQHATNAAATTVTTTTPTHQNDLLWGMLPSIWWLPSLQGHVEYFKPWSHNANGMSGGPVESFFLIELFSAPTEPVIEQSFIQSHIHLLQLNSLLTNWISWAKLPMYPKWHLLYRLLYQADLRCHPVPQLLHPHLPCRTIGLSIVLNARLVLVNHNVLPNTVSHVSVVPAATASILVQFRHNSSGMTVLLTPKMAQRQYITASQPASRLGVDIAGGMTDRNWKGGNQVNLFSCRLSSNVA